MNKLVVLCKDPLHLLSLGLGSGLSPKAPGTAGSVMAVIIYVLFLQNLEPFYYTASLIVSCLVGVYLCGRTARALGVHDHPAIVWDEFAGMWLCLFLVPEGWVWVLIGFLLFRLFDIVKPFPISVLDKRMKGGLGIMIDDIVAGLFAWLVMQTLYLMIK